MIDLAAELLNFPSAFDPQYRQLPGLVLSLPQLGAIPIETDGKFWQPAESGPPAVVVPAYYGQPSSFIAATVDEPEQPHDLIAFYPDQPRRWWWRIGVADMLGGRLVARSMTWGTTVYVVSNPLGYLRTRGNAVCLLKSEAASKLIGATAVICDDVTSARRVRRSICRPPAAMPRILVLKKPAGRDFAKELVHESR